MAFALDKKINLLNFMEIFKSSNFNFAFAITFQNIDIKNVFSKKNHNLK